MLGDFGVCWDNGKQDKYIQNWWENKTFTTIAIAGNHENYDLLYNLPMVEKFGGRLFKVSESVYYTMSGDIYNFNGHKCLCINGAESHDKEYRTKGISWWPQESIDEIAIKNTFNQLETHLYDVDYVFTHTGGSEAAHFFGFRPTNSDLKVDDVLLYGFYRQHLNYKHYCGHYHKDIIINNKTRILYNDIIEIF